MTGGDPFAHDDAAYVLGLLPLPERAAFERHLADCPACQARVDQLADMPGLLATLEPEDADALLRDDEPPDAPAEVSPATGRGGGRRIRRGLLAAAAGLAAAAALVTALVVTHDNGAGNSTA